MTNKEIDSEDEDCLEIDARGMFCPDPLNLLRASIRKGKCGQRFCLLTEDPASLRDVKSFCNYLGHRLIEVKKENLLYRITVEKAR